MSKFKEIAVKELSARIFKKIGDDWMLLAAENEGRVNMMTASWGGLGFLWNKPVSFVFFRPARYTLELVNASDTFSMSFFGEGYRNQLKFCGANSGRDVDKVRECGFHVLRQGAAPYFEEANLVLICKKLYIDRIDPEGFVERGLDAAHYPKKDYHYMFVSEVTKIFEK